jgi:hypothetical protein
MDRERPGLTHDGGTVSRILTRVLASLVSVLLLALVLFFSAIVFVILVAVGLTVWGYLWYQTRKFRGSGPSRPPGGEVIEGEVIRERDPQDPA